MLVGGGLWKQITYSTYHRGDLGSFESRVGLSPHCWCCWGLLWKCCRPPRLGSEHINEKKLFFLKFRLFSCFAVDFILRSFLFTHIGIVILTNKKYFLHRALLFSLWVVKLYFWCSEWANELHNVNSARPRGLAKYYHRSELSVLITSQLRIKLIPE